MERLIVSRDFGTFFFFKMIHTPKTISFISTVMFTIKSTHVQKDKLPDWADGFVRWLHVLLFRPSDLPIFLPLSDYRKKNSNIKYQISVTLSKFYSIWNYNRKNTGPEMKTKNMEVPFMRFFRFEYHKREISRHQKSAKEMEEKSDLNT